MEPMNTGVYIITNTANGKCYIGSSVNLKARWTRHRSELKCNRHSNNHLQAAYKKYGLDAFTFTVLLYCAKADLLMFEQRAIDAYGVCNPGTGYNTAINTSAPATGLRWKCTQEQNARKSAAMKRIGHKPSDSAIDAAAESHRGKPAWNRGREHPEATRQKISKANTGHKPSQEARARMSESAKSAWAKRKAA